MGLALVLALNGAAPARATTSPGNAEARRPRLTPDEIAAVRAEGDAIIFSAQAGDLFDNETGLNGDGTIILRHRPSGFMCVFEPGRPRNNHVIIYPADRRGDDVGCETITMTGDRTMNFTRDSHSDDQTLAGAARAIQMRISDATLAPAPAVVEPFADRFPGVPTPKSARFLTANTLEEVLSAHVDGWQVEARFTAPRALSQTNAIDIIWYATVADRLRRGRPSVAASVAPRAKPNASTTP